MVQLLLSHDSGVRKAANLHLTEEEGRKRLKFRPAALVNSIRSADHPRNRRAVTKAATTLLAEEEDEVREQSLISQTITK